MLPAPCAQAGLGCHAAAVAGWALYLVFLRHGNKGRGLCSTALGLMAGGMQRWAPLWDEGENWQQEALGNFFPQQYRALQQAYPLLFRV